MAGGRGRAEGGVGQGRCRGDSLCYRTIMVLRGEGVGVLKSYCRMRCEDILHVFAHGRCCGGLLHAMQTRVM